MFSAPRLVAAGVVFALVSGAFLAGTVGPLDIDPVTPPAAVSESPSPVASPEPSAVPTPTATPVAAIATARQPFTRTVVEFPVGTDPVELVRSHDGLTFYIDRSDGSVMMVDLDGYATAAIREGDTQGPGEPAIDKPRLITPGDPYLVVIDDDGGLWTWDGRPGGDWLLKQWATDGSGHYIGNRVIDPETPAITSFIRGDSDWDLLTVFADGRQVVRYRMGPPSGTLFKPPKGTLIRPYDEVTRARDLYADPDLYALLPAAVLRFRSGRLDEEFALEAPSGDTDYRFIDGTGTKRNGRLYVYDAAGGRILEHAKSDGRLISEWATGPEQPAMADVRGMYALAGTKGAPPSVTWMAPDGIYESVLSTDPADAPEPDAVASDSQLAVDDVADANADIVEITRSIRLLIRRVDNLQSKPDTTATERAEIQALTGQIAALQQDIEQLSPDSTTTDGGEPKAIDWQTPSVGFEADRLRIEVNGLTFKGTEAPFLDYWADGDDREYNAEWREHDRWMRLWFFLDADDTHWWVNEIYTYDGKKDKDSSWLYYKRLAPLTRTPRGEALEMDLQLAPSEAQVKGLKKGARLRIDGMRLTAFAPGTNTAPLEVTGCQPVPADAGVLVEVGEGARTVEAIDYFAEGTLLEGIDVLTPTEASERLTELGICHEFRYSYDFIDRKKDMGVGTSERWCSVPPVVRPREYEPLPQELLFDPRNGQVRRQMSITDDGYVRISVRDEAPRERRMQPPAGWNCPTY